MIFQTIISMLGDRATYNPVRLAKSLARLPRSPWLSKDVRKRITDYNRVGFHPNDNDNTELLAYWTKELFGAGGQLEGNLKGAAA
jgi:predicted metal-dependent hydrolase